MFCHVTSKESPDFGWKAYQLSNEGLPIAQPQSPPMSYSFKVISSPQCLAVAWLASFYAFSHGEGRSFMPFDCSAATTTVRHRGKRRCNLSSLASCSPIGRVKSVKKVSAGECDFASSFWIKSDRAVRHLYLRLPRQAPRIVACFCISKPLSHRFVLYIIKLHLHELSAEKYEKYQIQPLSK